MINRKRLQPLLPISLPLWNRYGLLPRTNSGAGGGGGGRKKGLEKGEKKRKAFKKKRDKAFAVFRLSSPLLFFCPFYFFVFFKAFAVFLLSLCLLQYFFLPLHFFCPFKAFAVFLISLCLHYFFLAFLLSFHRTPQSSEEEEEEAEEEAMKVAGCSLYLAASCLHIPTNLLLLLYFFTSPCMSSGMGERRTSD